MRQYVVYAKLITSTNLRRSDGTPLDGWHGVSGRRSGSSWRCITKCDTLSWFDLTRFLTAARVRDGWYLRAHLKAGRVGMDDRWFDNSFQIFEAAEEINLRLPWWFYVEERILTKTTKSRVLAPVHILRWEMQDKMTAEIGALWK